MKNTFLLARLLTFLLVCVNFLKAESNHHLLSLNEAVELAIKNDAWLVSNSQIQSSIELTAVSESTLPDPTLSFDFANLPTDTFRSNQEMMTQAKIGFSQKLPRGESLALKQKHAELSASIYPILREDRKAKVEVIVSQLWLDIFKAQHSISLIENDRSLFEQLVDVAQINYASTIGNTRQLDIIRAQLELTRLDDRLINLKQLKDRTLTDLRDWVSKDVHSNTAKVITSNINISKQLPVVQLTNKFINIDNLNGKLQSEQLVLYELISNHPKLRIMNQKVAMSKNNVHLAKESFQPEWGVRASYAYRENDPAGIDRKDFFSVGVSFDLPIFTKNKQNKMLDSAKYVLQSEKTNKWLLAKNMITELKKENVQLIRFEQRLELYKKLLLPQMQQQADAALTSYTNDDGDFTEVVRSRIAFLNANIDFLNIKIEKLKTLTNINYLLVGNKETETDNEGFSKSGEKR
ncbi:MAG: TolC family protein [Kangiellaceae bacterium]